MRLLLAAFVAIMLAAPPVHGAQIAARCADVTITPNSGDGLFNVRTKNVACRKARRLLKRWGTDGYPGAGPGRYECREVKRYAAGNSRVKCTSGDKSIAFDTGL